MKEAHAFIGSDEFGDRSDFRRWGSIVWPRRPRVVGQVMDDVGSLGIVAVGDIAGDFFVPAYQRGYRWTDHEVGQLLQDIRDSNGATYYLQPVVVKARNDGVWELVDGQQRLTTLYLIFRYLARTHLPSAAIRYTITYDSGRAARTTSTS